MKKLLLLLLVLTSTTFYGFPGSQALQALQPFVKPSAKLAAGIITAIPATMITVTSADALTKHLIKDISDKAKEVYKAHFPEPFDPKKPFIIRNRMKEYQEKQQKKEEMVRALTAILFGASATWAGVNLSTSGFAEVKALLTNK